jgi:hypothetical protein
MNDQLAKPLFSRLHGRGDKNANGAANDRVPAHRRTPRGRAGTQEATLRSAVTCFVAVVCLLYSGPVCFGQSAPPPPARSAPPEDILNQFRSTLDTTAERIKALDQTIAKAKQLFDVGTAIVTGWKNLAVDFDAYKVAAENAAADCRETADELEKMRRKSLNRDSIMEYENMLSECRSNVRRRIAKVARFEEILRRADLEIIKLVAERVEIEAKRIKGASVEKEAELAEKKIVGGFQGALDDGRKFITDSRSK